MGDEHADTTKGRIMGRSGSEWEEKNRSGNVCIERKVKGAKDEWLQK